MKSFFGQLTPKLKSWRHDFHQHPEIGFQEIRTSQTIANHLKSLQVDHVHTGIAKTGVVATIRGTKPLTSSSSLGNSNNSVALRADIDALPMLEEGNPSYKSKFSGKFHGCGHDGHTTMLLGACAYLALHRHTFSGTVHAIFQPAEEGDGGAKVMIEQGLFEKFPSHNVFAMHNWPGMPFGVIDVQAGPRMASSDNFDIEFEGVGGHAAMPHLTRDSIVCASAVVLALQTLVSRVNNPADPLVLSVTRFFAGSEAYNVIPSKTKISGTMRCFSPLLRKQIRSKLTALAQHIAQGYDCEANVHWHALGFPPTVNDAGCAELATRAAVKTVGNDRVSHTVSPSMGAEDFSHMLEVKPGAYVFLGAGEKAKPLHHPLYDFNDELLPIGAELFVNLALESLASQEP